MTSLPESAQQKLCALYGATFVKPVSGSRVGIADNVQHGIQPINGLRHLPEGRSNGWYIWASETFSKADDFFKPMHVEHIEEVCPEIEKYLGLAPGWRFLIAPGYEDVWFDEALLLPD